jgi:hypothetical protein
LLNYKARLLHERCQIGLRCGDAAASRSCQLKEGNSKVRSSCSDISEENPVFAQRSQTFYQDRRTHLSEARAAPRLKRSTMQATVPTVLLLADT